MWSKFNKPTQQQIEDAFKAFDYDKGGSISHVELREVLRRCGVDIKETYTKELMGYYSSGKDEEGNPEMDVKGFESLITDCYELLVDPSNYKEDQASVI